MKEIFWSPLDQLPEIVSPHQEWLKYVCQELNDSF